MRFVTKRAWFGSAAIIGVFAVAACGDEGDAVDEPTAGKAGMGSAGKAGSPSDAGAPSTSGSTNGGSAGKGGMAPVEAGMGGEAPGGAGEPGVGGVGGDVGSGGAGGELSPAQQLRLEFAGMSPLPAVPADTTNQYADNAGAAALGQRLFFDEKFSGTLKIASDLGAIGDPQKVSCASCHSGPALDDERSNPATVAIGVNVHTRNSPAVVNSAFYTWTNWGGRFSAQWELPIAVVESGVIMGGNRLAVAHRIFDVYKTDYEAVFGALTPEIGTDAARFPAAGKPKALPTDLDGAWEGMAAADRTIVNRILANYAKALQAYMRKLVSREAPFDLFMAGDDSAMSEEAQLGARVFVQKGCRNCHSGPTFSDQSFHDLGVAQTGVNNIPAADDGRFKDTPGLLASIFNRDGDFSDDKNTGKLQTIPSPLPDTWKGVFRTPSLRGVALTAPYMHSGQLTTLSDVIDFYELAPNAEAAASELQEINITLAEKAQLIAFLESLTGKPVDAALVTDTAAP
jgi:cytochrome c peroxidase